MPTTYDLDTERRDIDVAADISRYIPDDNPWLVLMLQSRKQNTTDPEFKWFEEDVFGLVQ